MSTILAIANCYVPLYAQKLPEKFDEMLTPQRRLDHVVCLGGCGGEVIKELSSRFSNLIALRGAAEFDDVPTARSTTYVLEPVDGLRILFATSLAFVSADGPSALVELARERRCQVVVHNAGNTVTVLEKQGLLVVGAGSATGTPLPGEEAPMPSLVCLVVKPEGEVAVWAYHQSTDDEGQESVGFDTFIWSQAKGLQAKQNAPAAKESEGEKEAHADEEPVSE